MKFWQICLLVLIKTSFDWIGMYGLCLDGTRIKTRLRISFSFFNQCEPLFCLFLWASVSLSALVVIMCSQLALCAQTVLLPSRMTDYALEEDDLIYSADIQDFQTDAFEVHKTYKPRGTAYDDGPSPAFKAMNTCRLHLCAAGETQARCLSVSLPTDLFAHSNPCIYTEAGQQSLSVSQSCLLTVESNYWFSHTELSGWSPGQNISAGSTCIIYQCLWHMIVIPLSCPHLRVCVCVCLCGMGLRFMFSIMRCCFTLSSSCMENLCVYVCVFSLFGYSCVFLRTSPWGLLQVIRGALSDLWH